MTCMHRIERTRQFGREARGRHRTILDAELASVMLVLADDGRLDAQHWDHASKGAWKDFCECHLRSDSPFIYQMPEVETLRLVRLGSRSKLGLGSSVLRSRASPRRVTTAQR